MSDFEKKVLEFKKKLDQTEDVKLVETIRSEIFGKNGFINQEFKRIGTLSADEKKNFASSINKAKQELQNIIRSKENEVLNKELNEKLEKEKIDVTLPEKEFKIGKIHPVSQVIDEISCIFSEIGFSVEEGPDVENDYNNFTALNTPENHPAKDMHDTFYIEENMKTLLRTHTSPVQIRTMEKSEAPHRIICPGKVYRKDSDLTHTPMFHQIEGLVVEEGASFAQLKGLLNDFLTDFFGEEVELRFRPSYFPFTEPSAEVDIRWKKNCVEVLGCGMVHPNVLKSVGVDTKKYSGFAFGLGVERMAMLKYDIPDLRAFFENDIRFLDQF